MSGTLSKKNSTHGPLSAATVFNGESEEVTKYVAVVICVVADENSAIDGLSVEFSTNNLNWDKTLTKTIIANVPQTLTIQIPSRYIRIIYTNGGTDQTEFRLQTTFHTNLSPVSAQLPGGGAASLQLDNQGNLATTIKGPVSSYGDISSAELTPIIQINFPYNINTEITNTSVAGSGAVTQTDGRANLSSGVTTASTARLDSIRAIKAGPGQGTLIRFSAGFTTGVADTTQIVGIGNDTDGLFFGYNGAAFGVLRRKGAVDTWITQLSWNNDKLNGAGPSGQTLNTTNVNIYQIQFQWLGFGVIKFFIESPSGDMILVHAIEYAGSTTAPSILNPTLPLMALVDNNTTTDDLDIILGSMGAFIEGKNTLTGPLNSTAASVAAVTTTETGILTIRNKTTYIAVPNRAIIVPTLISAGVNKMAEPIIIRGLLNATVATPTYVDISAATSTVEVDTAGTLTAGTGIRRYTSIIGAGSSNIVDISSWDIQIPPGSTFTISSQATSGTADTTVSINWREGL